MNDPDQAPHVDVCQDIEAGLKQAYDRNPRLTDALCILGLEQGKIAVKQHYGFAKNESLSGSSDIQPIVACCLTVAQERVNQVNDLTLKEYVACIDKIKKSVHFHSADGRRGYYDFICQFFP